MKTTMRDVDQIIKRIVSASPDVYVHQLQVSHHGADDDGVWFFTRAQFEVQIESSTGMCPFLIEADEYPNRSNAHSIEEALATLAKLLHLEPAP
jgi:hypothetical protein